jgi:HPt (histidine-containing phosphotransfer) domain-containing protein
MGSNFVMLVGAILVMVAALGGSLWWSLNTMGDNTTRVSQELIPAEQQLNAISEVMSDDFAWQSQVNATGNGKELEALLKERPEDHTLETHIDRLDSVLAASSSQHAAQNRALVKELRREARQFKEQEEHLTQAVQRRHDLQKRFDARVEETKAELRTLTRSMESIQGRARLRYMATLVKADRAFEPDKTRVQQARVLHELTQGDVRAVQDALQDLKLSTVNLGVSLVKIGLCNNPDELNSILANEVQPTTARIQRRYDDLGEILSEKERRELEATRERFKILMALSVGEDKESLRSLRRQILDEVQRAAKTRQEVQASAVAMRQGVLQVQRGVGLMVTSLEQDGARSTARARWVALLAGLAALLACAMALLRIRSSVEELRQSNQTLEKLQAELREANQTLEQKVEERTEALAQRERGVRHLLNGLGEGVVQISLEGQVGQERSWALDQWFGEPQDGQLAWSYFFPEDEDAQLFFEMGIEQMADDIMPFELCVGQLPSRVQRGEQTIELRYRPVREGEEGELEGLLVIASDISAKLEAERAHKRAHEYQKLVSHILKDQSGFLRFLQDGTALLDELEHATDPKQLKMPLHTLKGNCAVYGAGEMAELCHHLEDKLEESRGEGQARVLSPEEHQRLRETWDAMVERTSVFCGQEDKDMVSIPRGEVQAFIKDVDSMGIPPQIMRQAESWLLEPAADNLKRLALHAQRIASQLGKQVQVQVQDNGVRTSPGFAESVWVEMVHLIRNSLDHGIEPAEERVARSKAPEGHLLLETDLRDNQELAITVYDDGRGIQWERLAEKARLEGLPWELREDLIDVMFGAGVSTRDEVSTMSGRGVGTTAVKEACERLGGRIEVESIDQRGTVITLVVPLPEEVQAQCA